MTDEAYHDADWKDRLVEKGENYTCLVPDHHENAYQWYLSELLIHLQDAYEHTDRITVNPASGSAFRRGIPRDVVVTHPAGSIGDEIRNLTEDTKACRIVDITSVINSDWMPEGEDAADYVCLYLQPEVPDHLMKTQERGISDGE